MHVKMWLVEGLRYSTITPTAVAPFISLLAFDTEFDQIVDFSFDPFPFFPFTHPKSSPYRAI